MQSDVDRLLVVVVKAIILTFAVEQGGYSYVSWYRALDHSLRQL